MSPFSLTLLLLAVNAAPDAAEVEKPMTAVQAWAVVERGLDFLDKEGVAWVSNKCVGCHHGPQMIWAHYEAQKRGFSINEKSLELVRNRALKDYDTHNQFKPNPGMDGINDFSINTVYLSISLATAPKVDEASLKALDKFAAYILSKQKDDGSWQVFVQKEEGKSAPIFDRHDVTTMWAVLVLTAREHTGVAREAVETSKEKALKWLKENPPSESTLALVLRILVKQRFGTPEEAQELVKELLARQNPDGGWSQVKDKPSDAMGTGQALWGLTAIGMKAQDPVFPRAWSFLAKHQKDNGSWFVQSRAQSSSRFSTYMGTSWAVIGLTRSLPE